MPITEFCKTDVATIDKSSSVVEAARRMREEHVGDLVVCHLARGKSSKPIGILTDRDIVVGAVALNIPLHRVRVEDVMTPTVVTVNENAGVYETIHLMETYGVRRLPVVSDKGSLVGIISSGDLLELLSQEIVALSKLSSRQKMKESEVRI
jgi:CBS domain-containing protein